MRKLLCLLLALVMLAAGANAQSNDSMPWNTFCSMLGDAIGQCEPSLVEQWNALCADAAKLKYPMDRDDAILTLYEAACLLGLGADASVDWNPVNTALEKRSDIDKSYSPNESIFANAEEVSPFESNPGQHAGWNYSGSARFFALGQSSVLDTHSYFAYPSTEDSYDDILTVQEAKLAVERLVKKYFSAHSGGYQVEQTDWSDPLLADAHARKNAILESKTDIVKGDALVQGETYTGTAYYISNSGSNKNNGKSPEKAWATLEKLKEVTLKSGDAVFFERGGIWYGTLNARSGVTYSAYGEGEKPIITGAPLDAENPENWTLHAETEDGAKIWKYKDKVPTCGVILLNGGEWVAKQVYPGWNGKRFVHPDGSEFILESGLYADLMYFVELNLKQKTGTNFRIDSKVKGSLYLRCDAGNPGEVYDEIEISMLDGGVADSSKKNMTIDNLHLRCYVDSGISSQGSSGALYQNCEVSWCGGGVQRYEITNFGEYGIGISGGGILLFGESLTAKNNYIHDCENKGIAIVINNGHQTYIRKNILAENNVIDRCGNGIYLYINPDIKQKKEYENILFTGNTIINSGMGWRAQNYHMLTDNQELGVGLNLTFTRKTGDVTLKDNLFYCANGPIIRRMIIDDITFDDLPVLSGNTYVQREDMLLVMSRDENDDSSHIPGNSLATDENDIMKSVIEEEVGDSDGKVIVIP